MFSHILFLVALIAVPAWAAEFSLEARDTVSAFELNHGDVMRYRLRNGQVRTLVLEETSARVLLTNLRELRKAQWDGGTLYEMRARVRIDGYPVNLIKYVGSQETFAVPYVINGMRLWLDAVSDALALMTDNHGGRAECAMNNDARFAANGARDPVAPVPLKQWYPLKRPFLDIAESYNGDDPYYGAYQGTECHAGLDINMPKGSPLFAPVDIDDHYLFNSLAAGDNNNRWRGIHKWPNGDVWTLQVHHLVALLAAEHQPIRAGAYYAVAAGVFTGGREHSHFIFKTRPAGQTADIMLDPWILFWQLCEQERKQAGVIRAEMQPLSPAKTGASVRFSSQGSGKGRLGIRFDTSWTFGDGGFSLEANPSHVFGRPGVYPVTLTVWDGVDRAATTQLITIDGAPIPEPALALAAPDEIGFVERRLEVRDTYGIPPAFDPHTITVVARQGGQAARLREVLLVNTGGGRLTGAEAPEVLYSGHEGWLDVNLAGVPPEQKLRVQANPKNLTPGYYVATVAVRCPACLNSPQHFHVKLDVREASPGAEVVIDDADPGFYATPYFWVGQRFRFWKDKGYRDFYLTNGGRTQEGEFVRFTPNLRAGRYEVSFLEETPFSAGSTFPVLIRHHGGLKKILAEPFRSRSLGTFEFDEGGDGYVQIIAAGATGQVLADAVRFRPIR